MRDVEGICECELRDGSSFRPRDHPHSLRLVDLWQYLYYVRMRCVNVSDGKLADSASTSGVGSETHIILLIIILKYMLITKP